MRIRCLPLLMVVGHIQAQFGDSSSSLLLRSLVEGLERNLVSKIEHVERTLRNEILDFGDRLSEVQDRVSALEKRDSDLVLKIDENTVKLDSVDTKIMASSARLANQFSDNLNIVGMSLTQLSDRTQVVEDLTKDLKNRLLTSEEATTIHGARITKIENDVAKGPEITGDDLQLILEQVQDTMGGANSFELESRIGDLELRFDDNLEEKLSNTTAIFDLRFSEIETVAADMNSTLLTLADVHDEFRDAQNYSSTLVGNLANKVEDAIAQSAALGDALAGSFQQYAMVTSQIYGLRAETDSKVMDVKRELEFLNSTLEIVAMSVNDFGENSNALQDVYIIKGQVLLQEQTVNEMKARMEGQLADVGTKTESFQNEITNMQKFQESEGERQQAMWDENAIDSANFKTFVEETSTTLTGLTSKIAITDEKLTKTFNLAEQAKNGLKNINRKVDPLTSLEPKLSLLERSLSASDNRHKQNYLNAINDFNTLNATTDLFAIKLDQIVPEIQENTNGVGEIKRIKMDIETLRRNLQFQAARISGGSVSISGSAAFEETVSSEEVENLKVLLAAFENQIETLESSMSETDSKMDSTIDTFKQFQIKSAAVTNSIQNSIAVASEKCNTDLAQHTGQIETIKSSMKVYGDDLFESQTDSDKKLEVMETSISSMISQVNEFSHSQKTLSSYVNNFKQDVEISIAGYLTHFQQYIEKRNRGTQTTVRYVASTEDTYESLEDQTKLMPFNGVVTDPSGSSNGAGIMVSVSGRYQISVTTACVKGTIVYLKILGSAHDEKQSIRLYETAWSATSNSIVLDLPEGDNIMVSISENGKVVDGKYNYLTVSLAEPL